MSEGLITDRIGQTWDAAYANGRYELDKPLSTTQDIINYTREHLPPESHGLYIGCGNGRNFIPMLEAGLYLDGIDLSQKGIDKIKDKLPADYTGYVRAGDFHDLSEYEQWDYLVALQVFQYGNQADSAEHFTKAAQLTRPGGLLFLLVNSASTNFESPHILDEGQEGGSRTVRYPSRTNNHTAVPIHYFERDELAGLAAQNGFIEAVPTQEVITPHKKYPGSLSQWQAIWQRAA